MVTSISADRLLPLHLVSTNIQLSFLDAVRASLVQQCAFVCAFIWSDSDKPVPKIKRGRQLRPLFSMALADPEASESQSSAGQIDTVPLRSAVGPTCVPVYLRFSVQQAKLYCLPTL